MTRRERHTAESVMNALLEMLERLHLTEDERKSVNLRIFLYNVDRVSAYDIIAFETSLLRKHRIPFKRIAETINKSLKELQR